MWLGILGQVGLGMVGILFYTLVKSITFFVNWNPIKSMLPSRNPKGSLKKLLGENAGAWIWSILMLVSISLASKYSPDSLGAVLGSIGLDAEKAGSFFSIGLGLSLMIKEAKKGMRNLINQNK